MKISRANTNDGTLTDVPTLKIYEGRVKHNTPPFLVAGHTISVSPNDCFILDLILISMPLR